MRLKMRKNYYKTEEQESSKNQKKSRLKMNKRFRWHKFKPKQLQKGFSDRNN